MKYRIRCKNEGWGEHIMLVSNRFIPTITKNKLDHFDAYSINGFFETKNINMAFHAARHVEQGYHTWACEVIEIE